MTESMNAANESAFYGDPLGLEMWMPKDASLLTVIAIDTLLTLLCGCIITAVILYKVKKRAQSKEERDKLGQIVKSHYWDNEESISHTLQVLAKMKQTIFFQEVTELHVLAYKYRCEHGVYGTREYMDSVVQRAKINSLVNGKPETIGMLKKIERLFDVLRIQLPCEGRCPKNIAATFSATVFNLANETAMIWSDAKGRLICSLVHYFAGRVAAEQFHNSLVRNEELECLVMNRLPYVDQLYLNDDHFVLQEVDISNDLKIDLKNKVRYIDTVLAKNSKTLNSKEKNIMESYYTARDLCLKYAFIQNKSGFPDILSKVGEPSKLNECVVYLRHLLRIMCSKDKIKKIENDDKFFQFLMLLHEALYTWSDTNTMIEIIERIRSNIYCYLKGLTIEQMLIDKEFTKAKLEQLEKDLYKHLNYLTIKQVRQQKERNASVLEKIHSIESESSIYTMALSTSSYLLRQPSMDHPGDNPRNHELELMHQQRSLDQSSIVSGSSMFATALSLGSGNDLNRVSPTPGISPPRACSPPLNKHGKGRSPINGPDKQTNNNLIDINEYFETSV